MFSLGSNGSKRKPQKGPQILFNVSSYANRIGFLGYPVFLTQILFELSLLGREQRHQEAFNLEVGTESIVCLDVLLVGQTLELQIPSKKVQVPSKYTPVSTFSGIWSPRDSWHCFLCCAALVFVVFSTKC